MPLTYKETGVDYDAMDPFKRMCQMAAVKTADNIRHFGISEITASRGESAFLLQGDNFILAHVEEGLGTKNLVADDTRKITGKTYYDQIAQCTVAMIVNDMITVGALPISIAMHLAVGDSEWLKDEQRNQDLVAGWQHACDLSGAVWAGGETPTLKGIIIPGTAELNGSAIGIVRSKNHLINPANIEAGDAIVFLASSGIHANGLTLARQIAAKHPKGYAATLSDGSTYGEALLAPTLIYTKVIARCQLRGVPIHYAINITGHGWRKLMRAPQTFSYVINRIPEPQPVFRFIQEHGPVDDREAFGNLNMGAGFALIVP